MYIFDSSFVIKSSSKFPDCITPDGVIYNSWKIVASPPPPLRKISADELPEGSGDYTEIKNGTTVTLYYKRELYRWVIASVRNSNISTQIQPGTKLSFMEAMLNAIRKTCPKFCFAKLPKTLSYTIGFSHPDLHPFCKMEAWLISIFDSEKNCFIDNKFPAGFLPSPQKYQTADLKTAYKSNPLGIIVISADKSCRLLCESPKFARIRELFYDAKINSDISKLVATHEFIEKNKFLCLKYYLQGIYETLDPEVVQTLQEIKSGLIGLTYNRTVLEHKEIVQTLFAEIKNEPLKIRSNVFVLLASENIILINLYEYLYISKNA